MLDNRQIDIIYYFTKYANKTIISSALAKEFSISERTVKSNLKEIKTYLNKMELPFPFSMISIRGKGTMLQIEESNINDFLKNINNSIEEVLSKENRIKRILYILFKNSGYVNKNTLLKELNIGESTLYLDFTEVKNILKDFNLCLVKKNNIGYKINGREIDARSCITKLNINDYAFSPKNAILTQIDDIYYTVLDAFASFNQKIDEQTLTNISYHVLLAISRVSSNHCIDEKINIDQLQFKNEYIISNKIMTKYLAIYNISENYFESEVRLLTLTILGHSSLVIDNNMQASINEILDNIFAKIKNLYSIDLLIDEKIKLSLSLHLIALIYRAESGSQLSNQLSKKIQQDFQFSYDMAFQLVSAVEKKFNITITKDEIAYLVLYFESAIKKYNTHKDSKKIAILTDLRPSEIVLLRYKLLSWFPSEINSIDIYKNIEEINNIVEYDSIFSTYNNVEQYCGAVTTINSIPLEEDFNRISHALNGYTNAKSILQNFNKKCFYYGDVNSKDELLALLVNNAKMVYDLPKNFLDIIKHRETVTSSYFGNAVAIPHPLELCTNDTFVSVAILKKSIRWDDTNNVRYIFLVSFEKNNPKSLQFWYYFSAIIRDQNLLSKLAKNPNYEYMIDLIEYSLNNFNKLHKDSI